MDGVDTGAGNPPLVDWDYWLNEWTDHEVVWTRSNVKDQCPRPLVPLSQQLFRYEHEGCMIVLRDIFGLLPAGTDWDPMVGTFYGQLFANVQGNIQVGEVLPGTNRHVHIQQFLGLASDPSYQTPPTEASAPDEGERQAAFMARLVELVPDSDDVIAAEMRVVKDLRPQEPIASTSDEAMLEWLRGLQSVAADCFAVLIRHAMLGGAMYAVTGGRLGTYGIDVTPGLLSSLHADLGDNESAEMGRAVARLADLSKTDASSFALLRASEGVIKTSDSETSALLAAWTMFLEQFGHRGPGELELDNPSWRSDPSTLLAAVDLAARSSSSGPGPAKGMRETAEQQLEDHFAGAIPDDLAAALQRSRAAMSQRENGKNPIVLLFDEMRRLLSVVGPRLVERKVLEHGSDCLYLRFQELESMLGGATGPAGHEIAARRAAFERCRDLELPEIVVSHPDHSLRRAEDSVFTAWGFLPPQPPDVAGVSLLHGVAGASGRIVGVARVMASPWDDFDPGDILVANTVDPGWSPILACAGGIVLDLGGTMSHGVVVARELGIPCVVNVRIGTQVIVAGSQIEVDGDAGTVQWEPAELV